MKKKRETKICFCVLQKLEERLRLTEEKKKTQHVCVYVYIYIVCLLSRLW